MPHRRNAGQVVSRLLKALRQHAAQQPTRIALCDAQASLSYAELLPMVEKLGTRLRALRLRTVAILADNSVSWMIADLAALSANIPCVPVPNFFSAGQVTHVMATAGVDLVITDQPDWLASALQLDISETTPLLQGLHALRLPWPATVRLPQGTCKITFTSGTTGDPKGVCLGQQELEDVAESLRSMTCASRDDRHLSLLPLATLLENVGGVYTALLSGATACLPELAAVGLHGSSRLDCVRLVSALDEWQASSAILVPQMLQAMVSESRRGTTMPSSLRYLAVGGAPASRSLLDDAMNLGLPVHEGYGLSECASVVTVNSPGASRPGSVGRPLPHVQLEFAEDGEIFVRGPLWRGYLGDPGHSIPHNSIATGDTGYLDEEGYLHLTGRKKHMFITAYGRNVAPEWVESELISTPGVAQAVVFGEGRPFNSAVIVPMPGQSANAVDSAIAEANHRLPDYARVHAWVPAREPFSVTNGMATGNGRPRRRAIWNAHAEHIEALYHP